MKQIKIDSNPESLAKGLREVADLVTEQDKYAYLNEFRGSISSVNRYLKGEIHNIPVAVVMLQYFRDRTKSAPARA